MCVCVCVSKEEGGNWQCETTARRGISYDHRKGRELEGKKKRKDSDFVPLWNKIRANKKKIYVNEHRHVAHLCAVHTRHLFASRHFATKQEQ